MNWLYHRSYVGPNRRQGRFELRFIERRKETAESSEHASLRGALSEILARGLKWVDALGYFGPDRRSGAFSAFFFERRRKDQAGALPALESALRQLRVRVLGTETEAGRHALQERVTATAILAEAHGRPEISEALVELARQLETAHNGVAWSANLQAGLLKAEAMLDEPRAL